MVFAVCFAWSMLVLFDCIMKAIQEASLRSGGSVPQLLGDGWVGGLT